MHHCIEGEGNAMSKGKITGRPLGDRLLVRREPANSRSDGGIIIVDQAQEKKLMGTIIKAGPGKRDRAGKIIPMDVRDGDLILFGKYAGTEITLGGEELLIIKQDDVLMVLERSLIKERKSQVSNALEGGSFTHA